MKTNAPNAAPIPQCVAVHPVDWIVRSTRIDIISPLGALTPAQVAQIRAAMSR